MNGASPRAKFFTCLLSSNPPISLVRQKPLSPPWRGDNNLSPGSSLAGEEPAQRGEAIGVSHYCQ